MRSCYKISCSNLTISAFLIFFPLNILCIKGSSSWFLGECCAFPYVFFFFFFYCYYKSNLCHCRKHRDAKRTELLPSSPPGTAQADPWVGVLPLHALLPPQSPGTPGSLSCFHEMELLVWESDARSSSCPATGFCASLGRIFLSWDVRGMILKGHLPYHSRILGLLGRVQSRPKGFSHA